MLNPVPEHTIIQHRADNYDQLSTLEIVEEFNLLLKEVKSVFDENEALLKESDARIGDLLHYAELSGNLNASDGYRVYRQIAESRRERRRAKNENELLEPLMDFIRQNPKVVNDMAQLLGRLRGTKRCIDQRIYQTRTKIFEEE